jgi:hypothetical protein
MDLPPPGDKDAELKHPSQLKGRVFLQALWLPVWVLIGFFIASSIVVEVASVWLQLGLLSAQATTSALFNTVILALVYLLTTVIVIGAPKVFRKSKTSLKDLGLDRQPTLMDILIVPAGYVVYIVLSMILINVAMSFLPGFDPEQVQEVGFQHLSQGYEIVLAFLTLVVIAPVAEEVLMRGYLYGKLRKIVPIVVAIIITSVLFAFLHGQWNVAVDVFALSLVLTSLREVTGSIWSAILLHMMKNGVAFYILFINPSFLNTIGM